MKSKRPPAKNIDEYIGRLPPEVRSVLDQIRTTVRAAAPTAEEKISYGMPTFTLNGNLVHFAAFAKHIGFYPASSGIKKFQQELSAYKTAKGTVQFPFDKPVPYELISQIVKFRVGESLDRR